MRRICTQKNGAISQLGAEKITFPPNVVDRRTDICFYRSALLLIKSTLLFCILISMYLLLWKIKKSLGKEIQVHNRILKSLCYFRLDLIVIGHGEEPNVRDPVSIPVLLGKLYRKLSLKYLWNGLVDSLKTVIHCVVV